MGAGCSTGQGALDLLERDVVVMGGKGMPSHLSFQLPDHDDPNAAGSYNASQGSRGDVCDHGVTLRFLEKFHQKVTEKHFADFPEFSTKDVVQQEIIPSTTPFQDRCSLLPARSRSHPSPASPELVAHGATLRIICHPNQQTVQRVACSREDTRGLSADNRLRVKPYST
eukprot:4329848-Pyramimonas_sp.AAC.1